MQAFLARVVHFARRRRYATIVASGLITLALVIASAASSRGAIDRLNALVFDSYQTLLPRTIAESAVAVVDVDDESIRRLGQWPWSRTVLAEIVDRLAGLGAAAIGFDIVFSEPDRTSPALTVAQLEGRGFQVTYPQGGKELDNDRVLAASFSRAPVVSGLVLADGVSTPPPTLKSGFAFAGDSPADYLQAFGGSVRNLPILDEAAPGTGVFSFPPAFDGVVREIPILSRYGKQLYPALSVEALRVAQGASGYIVKSTGASGEMAGGQQGMLALKTGTFEVPTSPDGRVWVYYARDPKVPVVPVYKLLDAGAAASVGATVAGRIVLIGTSAVGLRDLVSTPLQAGFPGVLVHAEIIDQIVNGSFLTRPDWAPGLEIVVAVMLSIVVLLALPWLSTSSNALAVTVAVAAVILGGWLAFSSQKLLLSPIVPALAIILPYGIASGMRLFLSESEGRYIRSAFGHYLSPAMVQRLVDNPQSLVLGGESRELTLLFTDIRGFTTLSESMEATRLTVFLNSFLTPMTEVLMRNGATIDKYIGDAIMAFWNAPLDVPDHRQRACESVLAMQAELQRFNTLLSRPVKIGIGLNSGVCCVGNLGSRQRFDYSCIGDPVNLASRIEGLTKQYGLSNLLSESTAAGVTGLAMLEVDRVMVVGREEAISVFTLLGDRAHAATEAFAALKARHDGFLADYRGRRFDRAAATLAELTAGGPPELAGVYEEYAERLEAFRLAPPPADWDGAHRAEHK